MKRFNIFATMALAMVLGLGAAIGIGSGTKEVRSAKAAQNTYNFYVAVNTDKDVKVYYNAGYSVSDLVDCTKNGKTFHGLTVYNASIKDSGSATNFDSVLVQLFSGGQWSEQQVVIDSWSAFTHSGQVFDYSNNSWSTYSPDPATTSKTLYIDATNWTSGIGSNIPKCHYWIEWGDGNSTSYDDVSGTNITSVSGGGTYANKKWWSFTINPNGTSGLKFLFMYNSYAMQTANISYNSSYNAYYLSGTKSAAPEDSFNSNGSIHKVERYRKLGSASSTLLATDYLLGGESYQVPSIPAAPTGYSAPSQWCSTEAGATPKYSPNAWISNVTSNITLYALYTSATYTITYDRNNAGASSATATRTKEYNVAYTILDPSTFSWTPSDDKRFIGWSDTRDGAATHNPGDSYTTNAAKTYYYNEDWFMYRYKINNGSWINLEHNDTDKPSGVKAQFQAPETTLPAGGILSFEYSIDGGSSWSSRTISAYDGNYDTSAGIKTQASGTIYLKLKDDRSYEVWVPGESDRFIGVCNTSDATTAGTEFGMRSDGYTQTVTTTFVNIQKGQYLRRGWKHVLYETYLVSENDYFTQVGTETAVLCGMTGGYTVYNMAGSYNNWHDISIVRNDEASAKYLAQIFNDAVSAICSGITSGTKALSDLQAIWGSLSSTNLYKNFYGQPASTMAFFKTSSTTSDTDILKCVAKYDYVVKKYGTTALPDFLGRANGYSANPQSRAMITLFGQDQKSMSTIIVVAVSSIATIGAFAGYFFYKKKKEDR